MQDELDEAEKDEAVTFLSKANRATNMGSYAVPLILTAVADLPRIGVMVKSASLARINTFRRVAKGHNEKDKVRALCALIADSVVDPDGDRVWDDDEVKDMAAESNTQRFMELQLGVLQVNGLTKGSDDLETMEGQEKN